MPSSWGFPRSQAPQAGLGINTVTANIHCINTLGKRQELAKQWEQDKVHVALINETKRNIGGIEKGAPWGKYVCFHSTSIDPKKREANEKRREQQTVGQKEAKEKERKIEPRLMAKAKPSLKYAESGAKEQGTKGKGKQMQPNKKESDYKDAGVGIAIHT